MKMKLWLSVLFMLGLAWPRAAWAHRNGIAAEGCTGCHGDSEPVPNVTFTVDPVTVSPGAQVTITIAVQNTKGSMAGFYMESTVGTFKIIDSGTKMIDAGVTHTAPRAGSGGQSTFKVGWVAPMQKSGADFNVWAVSANGDGSSRGDSGGAGFLSFAVGCTGTKYFRDFDGDGYGAVDSGYTIDCSPSKDYAVMSGDCDDNDEKVNPGAKEICDGKDNNCDGMIDEGLAIDVYCEDDDHDGHGVKGKSTKMTCGVTKGFGLCDGDCNDNDPTIYPGAPELCNNRDDNCDGRVDEGARVTCGAGWCARSGDTCDSTSCTPGKPRQEECNDFDDDCDGVIDNGTDLELCKQQGLVCRKGECVPGTAGESSSGASGGTGTGTSSGAKSSSSGDGTVGACSASAEGGASGGHAYAGLAAGLLMTAAAARRRTSSRR